MENQYIWVIEDGKYSDYGVLGVFSTEQHAQLARQRVGGTIAKWPLDPRVHEMRQGYKQYRVQMLRNGDVTQCKEKCQIKDLDVRNDISILEYSRSRYYEQHPPVPPDCMDATVWAKDETHAIKIVNEYRTQWIAEGRWLS